MRNECGNEETHNHGSRIPYISLVTTLFTVYAQYTLVHLTWGLLRVRAACPTPCLNQRFELRPSWHNIHDTFPTGTAQNTSIETQTYSLPDSEHIHMFIDTRGRDDFVNAFLQCSNYSC